MLGTGIAAILFALLGIVMILIAEREVHSKNYWMVAILSFGMTGICAVIFVFFLIAEILT